MINEFSKKRIRCLHCNARRGLAPFRGYEKQGYGYCHACGNTFYPERNSINIESNRIDQKFIDPIEVITSQINLDQNIFFLELVNLGVPDTHLLNWNLGHANDGAAIFYYQDVRKRFVNAKHIHYDQTLHRIKTKPPYFRYAKSKGYMNCLFGEFQIDNSNQPIVLVESEKTAILASYAMPDKIWLATGGASSLTQQKAKILSGHSVSILFDSDDAGRRNANKALDLLSGMNIKTVILDIFQNDSSGKDLADYLIEQMRHIKSEIDSLDDYDLEYFNERAGIIEYCGNHSKYESELIALNHLKKGFVNGLY